MRITKFFTILVPLFAGLCFAGWERTYGGVRNDYGWSVAQTTDGGYVVAGATASFTTDEFDYEFYVLKLTSTGDTIWTRTYGRSPYSDFCYSIAQTLDNGYILTGTEGGRFWVVRLTSFGDTLWTRRYGGSGMGGGFSVVVTTDGGYILTGGINSSDNDDIYVLKLDSAGNTIWTKTYGGSGNDCGYSIAPTSDGGYIIAGESSFSMEVSSDVYILKLNSSGDTIWTRTYGSEYSDEGNSIAQTTDGGYIVSARNGNGLVGWLLKLTPTGDTTWTRTYGWAAYYGGCPAVQTSDGGYIATARSDWTPYGYGVYIVKFDSYGDTMWTRTYDPDCGISVTQTTDGGYIVAGVAVGDSGDYDVYIIKTDSLGYTGIEESPAQIPVIIDITAFPNPFNSSCAIFAPKGAKIEIFDVEGKKITELSDGQRIWTPEKEIGSGIYFVKATKKDGQTAIKRIVLLK